MGKKPNKKELAAQKAKQEAEAKKASALKAQKAKEEAAAAAAAKQKEEEEEEAAAAAAAAASREEEEKERDDDEQGSRSRRGSLGSDRSGSRRGSRDDSRDSGSRRGSRDSRGSKEDERERLRELHDFDSMRPFQLKDECRKRDLDPEGLRDELVERLLDYEAGKGGGGQPELELPSSSEMKEMRVSELTQLAKDAGISQGRIDDAADSDTPKPAIIELLMQEQRDRGAQGGAGSGGEGDYSEEARQSASDGTVSGSITLETELPKSAVKRREFEESIIRDLAAKMGVDPSRIRITGLEMVEEEIGSHDGARDGNRDPPRSKPAEGLGPGGVWSSSAGGGDGAEEEDQDEDDRGRRGRSGSRDSSGGAGRSFDWTIEELGTMKFSALSSLARKEGIDNGDIEECQDNDEPKRAIIGILEEFYERHNKARRSRSRSGGGWGLELPSISKLKSMRVSELIKLAKDAGVERGAIDDASDNDTPKPAIIELLMQAQRDSRGGHDGDGGDLDLPSSAELKAMKISELARLAKDCGVEQGEIDDATDSDTPRPAMIELLMQAQGHSASRGGGGSGRRRSGSGSNAEEEEVRKKEPQRVFGYTVEELRQEKVSKLRRIAADDASLSERRIEAAGDADNPKHALIELLCDAAGVSPSSSPRDEGGGSRGGGDADDDRGRGSEERDSMMKEGGQEQKKEAEKPNRIAPENYKKMKQAGLKAACQKRNLSDQGNAKTLLKRLEDYDKAASAGGGGGKQKR